MGTIKIGSSANRKGITVNPNEVFFNGNVVKSIMSGLTEIWSDAKALVPIMTSNTAPYGEVIYSGYDGRFAPYKAFNNTNNNYEDCWISALAEPTVQSPHYIGYKATTPIIVSKVRVSNRNTTGDGNTGTQNPPKDVILQGSNNGNDWVNLVSHTNNKTEPSAVWEFGVPSNTTPYLYHRLLITSRHNTGWKDAYVSIGDLQFYGTQLVGLVPTMTSNTTPSGEAFASSVYNNSFGAYKAFDGSTSDGKWVSSGTTNQYVGYKFVNKTNVKFVSVTNETVVPNQGVQTFKVQYSDDNSAWHDATEVLTATKSATRIFNVPDVGEHLYWRVYCLTNYTATSGVSILELQFYK